MGYREIAWGCLNRAKTEIKSGDSFRLRYAALELRMALEAMIYEIASNYEGELPAQKLNTWQPQKLLEFILSIDSYADQDAILAIGIEDVPGEQAKEMSVLGTDKRLTLKDIKKSYHKIGSYLHTVLKSKLDKVGEIDVASLSKTCCDLAIHIEEKLSTNLYNVDIRQTTQLDCQRCGVPIIRRVSSHEERLSASCIECNAQYTITSSSEQEVCWKPNKCTIRCPNTECEFITEKWLDQIKSGATWTCSECNLDIVIRYGVGIKES